MNDWVVTDLDESVSTGIGVGTGNKVCPVSDWVGAGSPNAAVVTSSGRVNVVARVVSRCRVRILETNLLSSGRAPV